MYENGTFQEKLTTISNDIIIVSLSHGLQSCGSSKFEVHEIFGNNNLHFINGRNGRDVIQVLDAKGLELKACLYLLFF